MVNGKCSAAKLLSDGRQGILNKNILRHFLLHVLIKTFKNNSVHYKNAQ